ncbi:MAG: sigma-70 family RNA polymerase sigma factor [Planctomycetaceae bacterium]|nr:sigma-70 family RNA polymerase sigma factor [Planctomycetaceae bacterium]
MDQSGEDEWGQLQPILDAALGGSEQAWGELLSNLRPLLRSRASQWDLPQADGSDIVQMVFEQALRDKGQFRGRSIPEFLGWLLAIEEHTLIGYRKHHQRQKRDERRVEQGSLPLRNAQDQQTSPSQRAIKGEQRRLLQEAIEQLDDRYRSVLQLQFLDGLTHQEISEVLGLTLGMVAQKSREGMKLIKKSLGIQ